MLAKATVFYLSVGCDILRAINVEIYVETRVLRIDQNLSCVIFKWLEHRLNWISYSEPVFWTYLFDIMIGIGKFDVEIQSYGNSIYQRASFECT